MPSLIGRCGGGGALSPQEGEYGTFGAPTIPAGTTQAFDWHHYAGASLLDLTNPSNPAVITRGVYAVSLTVSPAGVWTAGVAYGCQLTASTVTLGPVVNTATVPTDTLARPVSATLTWQMDVGDYFVAFASNFDSADQIMGFYAQVQLIGTY